MRTSTGVPALAAAALLLMPPPAGAAGAPSRSRPAGAGTGTSWRCPAQPPDPQRLHRSNRAGSARQMVPGRVTDVLVCAYNGVNDGPPSALAAAGIAHQQGARLLQRRLNRARHVAGGVYPCPSDDGRSFFVVFGYARGRDEQLDVARSGCLWASNGHRSAWTTGQIRRQLSRISHS